MKLHFMFFILHYYEKDQKQRRCEFVRLQFSLGAVTFTFRYASDYIPEKASMWPHFESLRHILILV